MGVLFRAWIACKPEPVGMSPVVYVKPCVFNSFAVLDKPAKFPFDILNKLCFDQQKIRELTQFRVAFARDQLVLPHSPHDPTSVFWSALLFEISVPPATLSSSPSNAIATVTVKCACSYVDPILPMEDYSFPQVPTLQLSVCMSLDVPKKHARWATTANSKQVHMHMFQFVLLFFLTSQKYIDFVRLLLNAIYNSEFDLDTTVDRLDCEQQRYV